MRSTVSPPPYKLSANPLANGQSDRKKKLYQSTLLNTKQIIKKKPLFCLVDNCQSLPQKDLEKGLKILCPAVTISQKKLERSHASEISLIVKRPKTKWMANEQ